MFRQDRTNPSTAVSNWKGRRDSKRGHPSTAVSTWLNGGLFGAAGFTAFGGVITQYEDSGTTYRVHTFRGSGKFVVSSGEADCDVLVVAGGGTCGGFGSGGDNGGRGGGGAGGLRTDTGFAASVTSGDSGTAVHTVTVGVGGPIWKDQVPAISEGTSGGNSSALGISCTGGGFGGSTGGGTKRGASGGSGGGCAGTGAQSTGQSGNAGGYSPVEGYAGGSSYSLGPPYYPDAYQGAGAGGGSAAVGSNASSATGGNGGAGTSGMMGISATTRTYAGGGGGGGATTDGTGNTAGGAGGVPNTGGGGNGKDDMASAGEPLSGSGAGIVIIRYEVAA